MEVNRSSLYYQRKEPSQDEISLEQAIRGLYIKYPFYGYRKVTTELRNMGFEVNHKRVSRIRRELGLETIYPKPRLSRSKRKEEKYPYLLKELSITRPNQVWASDITFIRLRGKGWVFVVIVLDWYSRYVLSYEISTSLEVDFCLNALHKAFKHGKPEIFNTDQGSQYTSQAFLEMLKERNIRISMDGKGRCLDNVRVERWWRSLKYEKIFLEEYETVQEIREAVKEYVRFYNHERIHQSLGYLTPFEVYNRTRYC